jgi:putative hydrolase of the HAD superfamily
LVVFDLGGVLVRIARTWAEAAAYAGLPEALGVATPGFEQANHALLADFQLGLLSADDYFAAVTEASGGACSAEDACAIVDAWTQTEYPGIASVFDRLDAAGVPAALLSNTNHRHWERLVALREGPPEYPTLLRARWRFASHLLGCAKPDRAIFRALEESTGVRGRRVLFFDDVEENVAGARAAGWQAELIDHGNDTPGQLMRHLRAYGVDSTT